MILINTRAYIDLLRDTDRDDEAAQVEREATRGDTIVIENGEARLVRIVDDKRPLL